MEVETEEASWWAWLLVKHWFEHEAVAKARRLGESSGIVWAALAAPHVTVRTFASRSESNKRLQGAKMGASLQLLERKEHVGD